MCGSTCFDFCYETRLACSYDKSCSLRQVLIPHDVLRSSFTQSCSDHKSTKNCASNSKSLNWMNMRLWSNVTRCLFGSCLRKELRFENHPVNIKMPANMDTYPLDPRLRPIYCILTSSSPQNKCFAVMFKSCERVLHVRLRVQHI